MTLLGGVRSQNSGIVVPCTAYISGANLELGNIALGERKIVGIFIAADVKLYPKAKLRAKLSPLFWEIVRCYFSSIHFFRGRAPMTCVWA